MRLPREIFMSIRGGQSASGANVAKNDAKNDAKNLTDRQSQIVAMIAENPQTTRNIMAAALGVTIKTIERELSELSSIVRFVGPKKGGHWEIIES